jgi:HD-GYP domain-containing protein (c-di-GMP phosphodiesterase class II)
MKTVELERIDFSDIVVGEPLPRNAYDESGKLLLRKGYIIESQNQLNRLINSGLYQNHNEIVEEDEKQAIQHSSHPFFLLDDAVNRLAVAFNDVEHGCLEILLEEILYICKLLQQACNEDMDACIGSIFMESEHRYTVTHPIHVAIICNLLGKELKMKEDDLMAMTAAAITANISIITLQDILHQQKSPLTDEQRQQIFEHPDRSVEMLSKAKVSNDTWIRGVRSHHEAMDGSGYPRRLKSYSIPLCAQVISIGDVFCASVSGRSYRTSLTSAKAMQEIFLSTDKLFESRIANLCVKLIGLYPPGVMVRLANEEIGVVTSRGEKAHLPFVKSIISSDGSLLERPLLRNCSEHECAVKEIVPRGKVDVKIDPHQLWDNKTE